VGVWGVRVQACEGQIRAREDDVQRRDWGVRGWGFDIEILDGASWGLRGCDGLQGRLVSSESVGSTMGIPRYGTWLQ